MIRTIIGTLTTRILIAGITLLIVLINARVLGAGGTGVITQIILAVTLIQLIAGIPGGGAIIYLVPRTDAIKLAVPSYLWGIFTAISGTWVLSQFETTRADGYMIHVLLLSALLTFTTINLMVLMGKERIRSYNLVTLFQVIVLVALLLTLFFIFRKKEISSYVIALYASYGSGFLISLIQIMPYLKINKQGEVQTGVIRKMFSYGGTIQAGNVIQFLNYRLGYFLVRYFLGSAALGIYSVGNSLSESLWIIGKSISTVQYSRISNENDPGYAARLTLSFVKICFVLTLIAMIILWLLIWMFFPLVFKEEFAPVKYVMLILGPGILTFTVNVILSPYFSGTGKPKYNMYTAAIGFAFTVITGLLLIPRLGLAGAALATTISYSAATLFQFFIFISMSGMKAKDFLLKKSEFQSAYRFFLSLQDKKTS